MKRFLGILLVFSLVFAICFMTACPTDEPEEEPGEQPPPTPQTVLTEIRIQTQPTKREYIEGDTLNLAGLRVRAYYDTDGEPSNKTLDPTIEDERYTVDPEEGTVLSTPGSVTITVTYQEKTATTTVTVNAKTITSLKITSLPTKREYGATETFDPAGLVLKAVWNTGDETDVTLADCTFEFNEERDMVTIKGNAGGIALVSVKVNNLPVANFGSIEGGDTETGTNVVGNHPFWSVGGWAKFGTGNPALALQEFATADQCGVEVTDGELKFTDATAGWNTAFFLEVPEDLQSSPALVGYDGIFTTSSVGYNGQEFQYSFNVKATGDFYFILWNQGGVNKEFTAGNGGFKLEHSGGNFTLAQRADSSMTATVSDAMTTWKADDWNRIDIVTARQETTVLLKIYINGYRIIWDETVGGQYAEFVDGNYIGRANQGGNFGPRFSVVPTGDTQVYLKKVAE